MAGRSGWSGGLPGAGLGNVGIEDGFEDGEGPFGTLDGFRWVFLAEHISGVVRGSRGKVRLANK